MKQIPQKVDIPGFEGIYYITIDGEVYRYGRSTPLKPVLRRDGYSVCLCNKEKRKQIRMNNIMRMCYFNNTKLPLKHLGSQSDFSYWNLKPYQRKDIAKYTGKQNRKPVVRIFEGKVEFYASATECAKANFMSQSAIAKQCSGIRSFCVDGAKYMWESDFLLKHGDEYDCN